MKKIISIFIVVIIFLSACENKSSTIYITNNTYYVSTAGSDNNLGTLSAPWRTIQKAATIAIAGDKIEIMQGSYPEYISLRNSGTSAGYITYESFNGQQVIINPPNALNSSAIEIYAKSYILIKGINLIQTGLPPNSTSNSGISLRGGSNNIILDSLTIKNSRYGITADGLINAPIRYITIQNCLITENTSQGIFLYSEVYDTIIKNNHITYNGGLSWAFGIEIGTDYPGVPERGAQRINIYGNEIDHNSVQGIRTWNSSYIWIHTNYLHHNGATGIQIENGSKYIVVENNISEYNSQGYDYETGAWIAGSDNVLVRNNTFAHNKIGLMVTTSTNVIVHHNYIYQNNTGFGSPISSMGFNTDYNSSNIYISHNTWYQNSNSSAQRGDITFCAYGTNCTNTKFINNIVSESFSLWDMWSYSSVISSDYNIFYNIKPLSVYWLSSVMSWSQYITISGQDIHSITGNPLFVVGDVPKLQAESPAIDFGKQLTKTVSAGAGNIIPVTDAHYFSDGLGLTNGDTVMIGAVQAVITKIDYQTNIITIDRNLSWSVGIPVSFSYNGIAPDIGVYEYQQLLVPTPTFTSTATQTKTPTATFTKIPTQISTKALTPTIKPTFIPTSTPKPKPCNHHFLWWCW